MTSRPTLIAVILASLASSAMTAALVGGPASGLAATRATEANTSKPISTSTPKPATPGASATLSSLDALIVSLSKQVSNLSSSDATKFNQLSSKIAGVKSVASANKVSLSNIQEFDTTTLGGIYEGYNLRGLVQEIYRCSILQQCTFSVGGE